MLKLSRINGKEFYINPEMIKAVEKNGDTVLTLSNHERILIRQSPEEICALFMKYKSQVSKQHENVLNEMREE